MSVEDVNLLHSLGRTIARDIRAPFGMPPFDRAAMDGYAISSKCTEKASGDRPVILPVTGEIQAGRESVSGHAGGGAILIMTGSVMPPHCDRVVKLEDVDSFTERGQEKIRMVHPVEPGENVAFRNEDFSRGKLVAGRGQRIDGPVFAMLACIGKEKVRVFKKPRLAVIGTGDELKSPGQARARGEIYDSNSHAVYAQALRFGGQPHMLGIARDTGASLVRFMKEGLRYDMMVLSGGVSEGKYDLVLSVLKKLGVRTLFWKIAIKPGKPAFFGRKGRTVILGLPGYPVSSYMNFEILGGTALAKMLGQPSSGGPAIMACLGVAMKNSGDRDMLVRVRLECQNGENRVFPHPNQKSGVFTSVLESPAFFILKRGERKKKGETIVLHFFAR